MTLFGDAAIQTMSSGEALGAIGILWPLLRVGARTSEMLTAYWIDQSLADTEGSSARPVIGLCALMFVLAADVPSGVPSG